MNPVLQPPHGGKYSYMVIGPWLWATDELPWMPRADPPPGLELRTWNYLKGTMFPIGRLYRRKFFSGLVSFLAPLLAAAIYASINFLFHINEPVVWVVLWVLCYIFIVNAFGSHLYVGMCRDAVASQAPSIEQTSIYRVHFHTIRRVFFVVGIVTFTRKAYSEPSMV